MREDEQNILCTYIKQCIEKLQEENEALFENLSNWRKYIDDTYLLIESNNKRIRELKEELYKIN